MWKRRRVCRRGAELKVRPPPPGRGDESRAARARTPPRRPLFALKSPPSHIFACRCTDAHFSNFGLGAIDMHFMLVLAAGHHPHLHHRAPTRTASLFSRVPGESVVSNARVLPAATPAATPRANPARTARAGIALKNPHWPELPVFQLPSPTDVRVPPPLTPHQLAL
jgi:hypothetical protein